MLCKARLWLFILLSSATALAAASPQSRAESSAAAALLSQDPAAVLFWDKQGGVWVQQPQQAAGAAREGGSLPGPCSETGLVAWLMRAATPASMRLHACKSGSTDGKQQWPSWRRSVPLPGVSLAGRKLLQRGKGWWPGRQVMQQQIEVLTMPDDAALEPSAPGLSDEDDSPGNGGGMLLLPTDPALQGIAWQLQLAEAMSGAVPTLAPPLGDGAPGRAPALMPAPALVSAQLHAAHVGSPQHAPEPAPAFTPGDSPSFRPVTWHRHGIHALMSALLHAHSGARCIIPAGCAGLPAGCAAGGAQFRQCVRHQPLGAGHHYCRRCAPCPPCP